MFLLMYAFALQLPYLEPSSLEGLNVPLFLPMLVDESTLRNQKFDMKIFVTISHCTRYCEADNSHDIHEFYIKFLDIHGGNELNIDFQGDLNSVKH